MDVRVTNRVVVVEEEKTVLDFRGLGVYLILAHALWRTNKEPQDSRLNHISLFEGYMIIIVIIIVSHSYEYIPISKHLNSQNANLLYCTA